MRQHPWVGRLLRIIVTVVVMVLCIPIGVMLGMLGVVAVSAALGRR